MKKIGLICLTLVIALGALGIGYAAWTDTVTMSGTVNTGTVDIVVEGYSGMWVYKDLDDDSLYTSYDELTPEEMLAGNYIYVASAFAEEGAADDTIEVTFDNIFPLGGGQYYWYADALLHYTGSIPVKVNIADLEVSESLDGLNPIVEILYEDAYGYWVPAEVGLQLEYCNYIYILIGLQVPQDNALQGIRGTVTGTIQVVQWNEYPYNPGP
jgi:predicted ribosomally synthesized peptide with SipW-like signal peptide